MSYVFYVHYLVATGEIIGHGSTDAEAFEYHKTKIPAGRALRACALAEYLIVSPYADQRRHYTDTTNIYEKTHVLLTVDKPAIFADGMDKVSIDIVAPEPVSLWVNGVVSGKHLHLEVVTRDPGILEIKVYDPRYWSDVIMVLARQDLLPTS